MELDKLILIKPTKVLQVSHNDTILVFNTDDGKTVYGKIEKIQPAKTGIRTWEIFTNKGILVVHEDQDICLAMDVGKFCKTSGLIFIGVGLLYYILGMLF